jgi:hypothetical protein
MLNYAMKAYGEVEVYPHASLIWTLDGARRFAPRKRAPGTHWIGGWVGPRAGLDVVGKRKISVGFEVFTAGGYEEYHLLGCDAV